MWQYFFCEHTYDSKHNRNYEIRTHWQTACTCNARQRVHNEGLTNTQTHTHTTQQLASTDVLLLTFHAFRAILLPTRHRGCGRRHSMRRADQQGESILHNLQLLWHSNNTKILQISNFVVHTHLLKASSLYLCYTHWHIVYPICIHWPCTCLLQTHEYLQVNPCTTT